MGINETQKSIIETANEFNISLCQWKDIKATLNTKKNESKKRKKFFTKEEKN